MPHLSPLLPSLTHFIASYLAWKVVFFKMAQLKKSFCWEQWIAHLCYVKIFPLSLKTQKTRELREEWILEWPSLNNNCLEHRAKVSQSFEDGNIRWTAAVIGSFGVCEGVVIKVPGKCMEMNSKSAKQLHNQQLMTIFCLNNVSKRTWSIKSVCAVKISKHQNDSIKCSC